MAGSMYNVGKQMEGTTGLGLSDGTKTFKLLLLTGSTGGFNADHTTLSAALAANPELNAGAGNTNGYYAGFSGTGRKSLVGGASITVTVDNVNDKVKITFPSQSWTSVAAAAGTVTAALLAYQPLGAATDSDLVPLLYFPLSSPVTPTGANFDLNVGTGGVWEIV